MITGTIFCAIFEAASPPDRRHVLPQKGRIFMWRNTWFMVKLACASKEKKVLALSLLSAVLTITKNLVNLCIAPAIRSALERHVPARELLMTIALFVFGLMAVSAALAYADIHAPYGKMTVRCELINFLDKKAAATSYPNVDDDRFQRLLARSGLPLPGLRSIFSALSSMEALCPRSIPCCWPSFSSQRRSDILS